MKRDVYIFPQGPYFAVRFFNGPVIQRFRNVHEAERFAIEVARREKSEVITLDINRTIVSRHSYAVG